MMKRGTLTTFAILTTLSGAAFAQPVTPPATAEEAQVSRSAAQTPLEAAVEEERAEDQQIGANDPIVFNGGIGLHERASAPEEGTRLEFFVEGGPYVSHVHVIVNDMDGTELVNTVTEGPWLILDLPDGEYDVHATFEDHTESSRIAVDSRTEKFGYMFPQN